MLKQKAFSWFDCYDIYDESGKAIYQVKGCLSWGHKLYICNPKGEQIGLVKEVMLTFLPKFEIYQYGRYLGCVKRELTFLMSRYSIDYNGWQVTGDVPGWKYEVKDAHGYGVAKISKVLFRWTDTYCIEVYNSMHALDVLMLVLSLDAEKCTRGE